MERTADPPLMRDYNGCGRGEATMRETESQDLGPELLPAKHSSHIPLHAHPFIQYFSMKQGWKPLSFTQSRACAVCPTKVSVTCRCFLVLST